MTDPDLPRRALIVPADDARKRALRTFLQGLAFDVLAAALLLLLPIISAAQGWSDLDWAVLGFLFVKTLVVAVFSYLMRYFSIGAKTLPDTE